MKKLYVIGIGNGGDTMTAAAAKALAACEVIVGYSTYIALLGEELTGKEVISGGMRSEKERCLRALEAANEGRTAALISSGDAGVYGMASLSLELAADFSEVEVEIVPGVTAALAGASLVGAPLGHDFAVVSLSDLLTPWEIIEKRLRAACEGDFALAIYNPESRGRKGYLARACRILLEYKSGDTPAAAVKNIGREGESVRLMTLREMAEYTADMTTTVFIGNSTTRMIGGRMVTMRGYLL